MRTLLAFAIVVAIVAAFSVFSVWLPRWRTGEERTPLVSGTVAAAREHRDAGPPVLHVELFEGRPARVPASDALIDDDAPPAAVGREAATSFRFSLDAGTNDGPRFFVRASVELPTFERFCVDEPLPPVRVVDGRWVEARTGRPLRSLRLVPRTPCPS